MNINNETSHSNLTAHLVLQQTQTQWASRNMSGRPAGDMRLAQALSHSRGCCSEVEVHVSNLPATKAK